MTGNTLKITFKQRDDHRDAARERLRRAEAGESGEAIEQDVRFVINFEEFDDVDRDYREAYRNLQELESLGVVEFETRGQRKKPTLRAGTDNIDFSIQFPRPPEDGDRSGASA